MSTAGSGRRHGRAKAPAPEVWGRLFALASALALAVGCATTATLPPGSDPLTPARGANPEAGAPMVLVPATPALPKLTRELDGTEIAYRYEGGGQYQVQYTAAGVRYRFLSGEAGDEWWGPFPYRAFKTSHGEYFVGWYEKGFGDQITHLVNLEARTLLGSGIIVKREGRRRHVIEHFQAAGITDVRRVR